MKDKGTRNNKQPPSAEDAQLWSRITEGVRPLHKNKGIVSSEIDSTENALGTARKPASTAAPRHTGNKTTRDPLSSSVPAPLPALDHRNAPGLDKRNHRRLLKGQREIEARLDLHGKTLQEARRALTAFIQRCHADGKRGVLVITGKGLRPPSGEIGVIRKSVPGWLNEAPLRPLVLAFSYATPKDGGEGALYVLIKRKA